MQERYIRNIPALTEQECHTLLTKKAAIVGCGGLGGYLAEYLARIGIMDLVLIDGDVFETSNLNRQLYAEPATLGKYKATVTGEQIYRINPDIHVSIYNVMLTAENADMLIAGCDVVLDGLDTVVSRKILKEACTKAGIPYIYGAVSGWVVQTAVSLPEDHLIDLIYPEQTQPFDNSTLSFTPALCASMQVSLCVKLLTGRKIQTNTVFYFDLLNQEYEVIPVQ